MIDKKLLTDKFDTLISVAICVVIAVAVMFILRTLDGNLSQTKLDHSSYHFDGIDHCNCITYPLRSDITCGNKTYLPREYEIRKGVCQ